MKVFTDIKDRTFVFELIEDNGGLKVLQEGKVLEHELIALGHNRYSLVVNGKSYYLQIIRDNGLYHIHVDGEYFPIRVEDERMRQLRELVGAAAGGSGTLLICAPIPGLVTRVNVQEGETISKGDSLLTLEAMKMENEIKAESDGQVKQIFVEAGAAVEKDQKLILIE